MPRFDSAFSVIRPVGVDGYYYVLQVDSLLSAGKLYFPSIAPAAIYFFALISFFIGDAVLSIKIGAIVLQILLVIGVFAVVFETTGRFWAGVFGMAIAAFSNSHFYYVGEFLSNLAAIMFLVWGVFGIIKFRHNRSKRWIVFSLATLSLSILSHRSALPIIGALIYAAVTAYCLIILPPQLKAFVLAVFLIFFFAPLVLPTEQFVSILPSAASEFLGRPESPFFAFGLAEKWILVLILCVSLSQFPLFPDFLEQSRAPVVLGSVMVIGVLFSLNPFLNYANGLQSVVGRLDTLTYLEVAIAAPVLIVLLQENSTKFAFFIACIISTLLTWSFLKAPTSPGLSREYLLNRENLARELQPLKGRLCSSPMVIAPHGKQFLESEVLEVPSQQKPSREGMYGCIYWLI